MAKKSIKYRFNEDTLSFEPIESKAKDKLKTFTLHSILGLVFGFIAFIIYSNFFDSPEAKRLKDQNMELEAQYEILLRQTQEIGSLLTDLEQRDENMYRAILQAEPIPSELRRGNFERTNRYASLAQMNHNALVMMTTREVDRLSRRVYIQSKSYDELVELMRQNEEKLLCIPSIQPVLNEDLKREASGYGWRIDPIYGTRKFHKGMDFSAPVGSDVYATGNGVVVYAGYERGGYGNFIRINHGFNYETYYAHLSKILVKRGQKVVRGEVIAKVGNTGKSVGP
nr:M23 family metallopeptidase [Bacteroidales bacterium]